MTTAKRFTLDEANALLPQVAPLLESLRDAQQAMEEHAEAVSQAAATNGGGSAGAAYLDASRTAGHCLTTLEELGIVVRDPATGLVDFPAEREGREIFLCWRLGEDAVAWWHPTDTGFSGRQPIE